MKFYSECSICGGPNHICSDVCTKPSCLAVYWREVADWHRQQMYKAIETAKELDRQDAALVHPAPGEGEMTK